jgi:hypothetical protein
MKIFHMLSSEDDDDVRRDLDVNLTNITSYL